MLGDTLPITYMFKPEAVIVIYYFCTQAYLELNLIQYVLYSTYVLRYLCHNSSACHASPELGHSHFLYMAAI